MFRVAVRRPPADWFETRGILAGSDAVVKRD